MNPEEQMVAINLPLPVAQQFIQVMEGITAAFYQALDTVAAPAPAMPMGEAQPTAQEAEILNALAAQE